VVKHDDCIRNTLRNTATEIGDDFATNIVNQFCQYRNELADHGEAESAQLPSLSACDRDVAVDGAL
jgi:hypothetical protein